jgi:hypothetical protein
MNDGLDDFGRKCLKGYSCQAYRLVGGRFGHLRNRAAGAALAAAKGKWSIPQAIRDAVDCSICAHRLQCVRLWVVSMILSEYYR